MRESAHIVALDLDARAHGLGHETFSIRSTGVRQPQERPAEKHSQLPSKHRVDIGCDMQNNPIGSADWISNDTVAHAPRAQNSRDFGINAVELNVIADIQNALVLPSSSVVFVITTHAI